MRVSQPTARHSPALVLAILVLLNLGTVDALVVCRSADGHILIQLLGNPCCGSPREDPAGAETGTDAAGPKTAAILELEGCGSQCQDVPLAHSFSNCRVDPVQLPCPEAAATLACAHVTAAASGCLRPDAPSGVSSAPTCLGAAILLL